jgi:hypothetical protein
MPLLRFEDGKHQNQGQNMAALIDEEQQDVDGQLSIKCLDSQQQPK